MSKSPAQEIAEFLSGLSYLSLVLGQNLFVSFEAALADGQMYSVSILDSSSFSPMSGYVYERPNIQVRVRAIGYETAYEVCKGIRDALHDRHGEVIGDSRYIAMWAFTEPTLEAYDEKRRPCVSCNLRLHRTTVA